MLFEAAGKEGERLLGYAVQVAGTRLGRGKLGQSGELVDQGAQGSDAAEDDLAALANDLGRIGLAALKMTANALGGEGDGGEGVLDFVGDTLGNFLPGELALGTEQLGHVFDDEDGPLLAVGELKTRAGDGKVDGAAARLQFNLSGGRAHALAAADDAGKIFPAVGGKQCFNAFAGEARILATAHQGGEGAIGLQNGA